MQKKQLILETKNLPDSPGVYRFLGPKKEILYIGKATSLRNRVRSYFVSDIVEKRSELIGRMVFEAKDISYEKTDSVLEALMLEAELIKKHLPPYNTVGKDQKSWNYVLFTKEKFPRILVLREREIESLPGVEFKEKFGPFTNGYQLREALKIIRRIFPYRDQKCTPFEEQPLARRSLGGVGCFNYQIGLCPGVCVGAVSEKEYARTLRHIILFFQGKKRQLVKNLEKEMKVFAKNREFEKAEEIKRKIFALQHIQDIALIKRDRSEFQKTENQNVFRIEGYDIAHISGTNMVGVMTVVEEGQSRNVDYRMFKIKKQKGADDTRALREVFERRFNHPEWKFPSLIVVDGGVAQMNAALEQLSVSGLNIPVVAVTKDERHKAKTILGIENLKDIKIEKKELERSIILVNSESHRFAINFHRKLRDKIR